MPRPDHFIRSLRGLAGNIAARRIAIIVLLGFPNGELFVPTVYAEPVHPVDASLHHPTASYIAEAALRFGIPEHWITAVIEAESAGNVRAISSAGAMGLMQVMPDTWAELSERYGLGHDPFDPRNNVLAGTAYLREMFDRYGSVAAMLAAYNAGPGRYDDYVAKGRTLPAETLAYVASLLPLVDSEAVAALGQTAPPIPDDWRSAPVFVALGHGPNATNRHLSEDRQRTGPLPATAPQEGNIAPPSDTLFPNRPAFRAGQ
ncbi:lytic transglycosylase domain-containing protein [Pelagibacterium lentulum]|uniref:Transglycosylase SLT domain-containing protein n=1 Tax=Pelagibacterium lentulum TaxID=2029865 RepID=A0A916RBS4_9HYPH|nr:lytic transglycosylase domain-containing protein [Pelagibacterium lentulum]GGA48771.1 hypothetical protein GCM10011499_18250 [Pelagibacterium lentulum]